MAIAASEGMMPATRLAMVNMIVFVFIILIYRCCVVLGLTPRSGQNVTENG